MLLKPTSISCVVSACILHAVPAVVDHAVVQATIHGAKTALDLPRGVDCNRDKITYILGHLNTQIRFIDAASVLLRHIDLRLKHMHGGIDRIHMRIEDLDLRGALRISRPRNLIAPHRAGVCRQIANGIDLVEAAVFATLRIADKRTQRRLCFVVNLGFQLGHAAIEANGAQPLATGCKCDVNRRAIQKRKHQDGELALVIGNGRAKRQHTATIDREHQRRHTRTARRRMDKRLRTLPLDKRGDILTGKTKQHKQTALTAAKCQTLDTHLHFSLSQGVRCHTFAGTQASKPQDVVIEHELFALTGIGDLAGKRRTHHSGNRRSALCERSIAAHGRTGKRRGNGGKHLAAVRTQQPERIVQHQIA